MVDTTVVSTNFADLSALSALSNDEVADGVLTWAGRVAAGEAGCSLTSASSTSGKPPGPGPGCSPARTFCPGNSD